MEEATISSELSLHKEEGLRLELSKESY